MTALSENLFDPAFGDWQERLAAIVETMRRMSRQEDPLQVLSTYATRMRRLMHFDRTLWLSREGLERPRYRVMRSDRWNNVIDPWKEPEKLPVLSGGILEELVYSEQPRLVDDLIFTSDDPAAEHLEGMRSLVAIPHFDEGVARHTVVHLRSEREGFSRERFPELVLISSLFGRATANLVETAEAKETVADTQEQYRIIAQLTNTVMDEAMNLKDYSHVLEQKVAERTAELSQANMDAIYMLAIASEAKDEDTGAHVRRIEELSRSLAREIGLPEKDAAAVGYSAVLHDIGKIHVPDSILKKPGPLTAEEMAVMQQHTLVGERILSDKPFFTKARHIARSHHENWDNTGYPDRLGGRAIPLEARIVHLADVYDALTNPRVYKAAWAPAEAMDFIRESSGHMFDPEMVKAFSSLSAPRAKVG